jgi:general stress protein 26
MSAHTKHKSDAMLLSDKIKDVRVAMMTTIVSDGSLHSRPMVTQDIDAVKFDGNLWFLTSAGASKVSEVAGHQQVNLSYSKPDKNLFVTVAGTAQLVNDRKKIKDLWTPMAKAWFQSSPDDPDIGLLKVHVEHAEFWEGPVSKAGGLFAAAKHLASHDEISGGSDVKLDLHIL